MLANGRGRGCRIRHQPWCANHFSRSPGSAALRRRVAVTLAAPLALTDIEALFAERIESRDEIAFDEPSASLRARRLRFFGSLALAEQPMQAVADEESARVLAQAVARLGIERLPWTNALRQWRDRIISCAAPRAANGLICRTRIWRAARSNGFRRRFAGKTALAQLGADELAHALQALLAIYLRRRLDAEAPTHFNAPSGTSILIDYAAEEGPKIAIRVQELFGSGPASRHCRGTHSPAHRAVVPGAAASADDARSSRLLARQLCRREGRDERPLSAPSLAG